MSRSLLRRAFGSLRRLLRARRSPRPSEQEWLRLILLVRRMQRGQLAVAQRLDEIRALTGVLGSFRSDFGTLHEQLSAARESAGELERGLSERLSKLDTLPDAREERAALDQRIRALDGLTEKLQTLAAHAPSAHTLLGEFSPLVARLGDLAARIEAAQASERAVGGKDELARLYERIQELAESLAKPTQVLESADPSTARDFQEQLTTFGVQLSALEGAIQCFAEQENAGGQAELVKRLERIVQRLDRKARGSRTGDAAASSGLSPEEFIPFLARLKAVALRFEELPSGSSGTPANDVAPSPELIAELEQLRIQLACELEPRRRQEAEMEAARECLRSSELARVELETRHANELAQMADHVGRQLQRVEDDLKKKKRGLAELTQQNIQLQNQLTRLQSAALKDTSATESADPPAPLPRSAPRERAAPQPESQPDAEG